MKKMNLDKISKPDLSAIKLNDSLVEAIKLYIWFELNDPAGSEVLCHHYLDEPNHRTMPRGVGEDLHEDVMQEICNQVCEMWKASQ